MAQVKIFDIFGLFRTFLAFLGLFWSYQISKQIVHGRFPLNKELAFKLTAYVMAQVKIFDNFLFFWPFLAFLGLFWSYQISKQIVHGGFPLEKELAFNF